MKLTYKLYFTTAFLAAVDVHLSVQYTKYIKREDFLHFFYILDSNKSNMIELSASIRNSFGRYIKNGEQHWKFKEIVNLCEDKNIIFSTSYSTDHKYSKSYGFTVDFLNSIHDAEVEFQFCEISEKKYNTIFKYNKIPTDPILLKHYRILEELEIDMDKSIQYLKTLDGEKLLRSARDINKLQYNQGLFVTQDKRTGRIFTNFNLMDKNLREFCTYKGHSLSSVDLKSSQPYLLASLLKQQNPGNKEVNSFYELIINNDIYVWIQYKLNIKTRKEAKEMFFSYFFKDNRGMVKVQKLIMKEFPQVYELIKKMKREEDLWMLLQKLEADIFVTTCNEFIDEGCLTVHDSLYFRADLFESVVGFLNKQFTLYKLNNYILN